MYWCKVVGIVYNIVFFIIVYGGLGGNYYVFERMFGLKLEGNMIVVYYE